VDATYNGTSFTVSSVEAGAIGTTPGALFVWGFDRGQGTARFLDIGITGVVFDSVVVISPTAGTVGVNDLIAGTATTLTGALQAGGSGLSATVPASLLPSRGLAPEDYTVNLWPRTAIGPGTDILVADFAPDNSNFRVTSTAAAVPEPASAALLLAGLAGLLGLGRRRAG
jgi:PEP-CTERM motif